MSTTTVTQPSYRQRLGYHAGLLGGICFLVSVMLIIGNMETNEEIQLHIEQEKRATLAEVLPAALYDNEPLADPVQLPQSGVFSAPVTIYTATKHGSFSGAALQSSVWGWGSDIQFIIAVDGKGEISGVRVISHKETPGLADKIEIEKDDWITRFNGHSLSNTTEAQWHVKKDGGSFDQFTGATITPRAVVKGIHAALLVLEKWRLDKLAHPPIQSPDHNTSQPQSEETPQ